MQLAERVGVPIYQVDRRFLSVLSGRRPSDGIALDDEPLTPPTILYLEAMQLPRSNHRKYGWRSTKSWIRKSVRAAVRAKNLGAILRSYHSFGAHGTVTCARKSAPLSPIVAKALCSALKFPDVPRFLNAGACKEMLSCSLFHAMALKLCSAGLWSIVGMSSGKNAEDWKDLSLEMYNSIKLFWS
ncbi:rRNA methyltransferase 1, mitochondrial [Porphyridium purpureum]|uniref:rRNA methyltransferase 1, mitochondrial n=1 Tax=Porphyridium purpureum TaxID=35688 RepID=A0A5J4YGT5_PORPP|nr:rRNA methyltransferase 1, mitochondrial [Porphyridium purpureum]KAA8490697.1 rRNA methyltransferase 1, mitochondrial [Porphyridium purpureum]|eukprot:POR3948..scf243_20